MVYSSKNNVPAVENYEKYYGIKNIEFTVEGVSPSVCKMVIDLEENRAIFIPQKMTYVRPKKTEVALNDKTKIKLIEDICKTGVLRWDHIYDALMLDGWNWSLKIKIDDSIFESNGYNLSPESWDDFYGCLYSVFAD